MNDTTAVSPVTEKGPETTAELLEEMAEEGFSLSDERIAEIRNALYADDAEKLKALIDELSEAEIADFFQKFDREDRHDFLEKYGDLIEPEVFTHLDSDLVHDLLSDMPAAKVAKILSELESDDALDLIQDLDPVFQKEILKKLSVKDRIVLEEGLNFPEESAGRLMQREYVAIPQFWTVGKTIDYLRAADDELPDEFYDLIVIDPYYHVVGEIPLNKLVRAKRSEKINDLTLDDVHIIPATMDQEEVAHLFRREGLGSAPVVDDEGRLVGVITVDDVIDVIDEEAQEDILNLAGVGSESDLYSDILSSTASRFKWLFVNLLTAILASYVISFFEGTIKDIVALAVLMPIVASMGGNAGTQTMTVAVRALATKELSRANMFRIIGKETLMGALNGLGFAVIMGLVAWFWFQNPLLGVVIGIAMVTNLICAGLFGACIPLVLEKVGADPAVSSSIFLTTVTDVVGFLGFLGLASIFLI
jgi:magnesium transporter